MKSEPRTDTAADRGCPPGERAGRPAGLPRLLPARPEGGPAALGDHLARHGPLPHRGGDPRRRDVLITEMERAALTGRGACRHPDGVVRMVRSALIVFSAEIGRHADGWCLGTGTGGVLPVPPQARR